jgi:PKD repeat protein
LNSNHFVYSHSRNVRFWLYDTSDDIGGLISLTQPDVPITALNNSQVSTGSAATFQVSLHDPTQALTNLDYQWLVDDSRFDNYTSTSFDHQFAKVGNYTVSAIVTGKVARNNVTHQGTIVQNVTALNPIDKIDEDGASSIVRDHNLKLVFDIQGGSPLFWYCYAILPSNKSILPCDDPTVTPNRTFNLEKYFREPGTFYLKVRGGNDVSEIKREIQIDVQESKSIVKESIEFKKTNQN